MVVLGGATIVNDADVVWCRKLWVAAPSRPLKSAMSRRTSAVDSASFDFDELE